MGLKSWNLCVRTKWMATDPEMRFFVAYGSFNPPGHSFQSGGDKWKDERCTCCKWSLTVYRSADESRRACYNGSAC